MTKINKTEKINLLFSAALEVQNIFAKHKWPFCFIGGLAVIRWGEIRMTEDIDLCMLCGFENEEYYIKKLLHLFEARILDSHRFALKNRVLLLSASNGVPIDISLSGLLFEEEMINRATTFAFLPNCSLITCSAEDLMVLKAFADRSKDWMDVESILMRQGRNLNVNYIIEHLTPLCELKEAPEIIEKFKNMYEKIFKII